MFNKKKKDQKSLTFISQNCTITGELDISGDILLDGHLDGSLKSDRTISVGESGSIKGFSSAKIIMIAGSVEGDLECDELRIEQKGILRGNIVCNSIRIKDGGQFFGQRLAKVWDSPMSSLQSPNQPVSIKDIPSDNNAVTLENSN
jgi:cytoskeletal protein CcmA (bactofilin family)